MSDRLLPESKSVGYMWEFPRTYTHVGPAEWLPGQIKKLFSLPAPRAWRFRFYSSPLFSESPPRSSSTRRQLRLLQAHLHLEQCGCLLVKCRVVVHNLEFFSNSFGVGFTKSRSACCRCISGRPLFSASCEPCRHAINACLRAVF